MSLMDYITSTIDTQEAVRDAGSGSAPAGLKEMPRSTISVAVSHLPRWPPARLPRIGKLLGTRRLQRRLATPKDRVAGAIASAIGS